MPQPDPGAYRLLRPGDPNPVEIINPGGVANCVLICEHAGAVVPRALGKMGLDDSDFGRHYAVDIGARAVTEHLARLLDAPAVVATYSRLVVDINRAADHETTFPVTGEGKDIPGNAGLTGADRTARLAEIYEPFDAAAARVIAAKAGGGGRPAILAVHSYTPVFFGVPRPWECGVLWTRDWPMSRFMIDYFRELGLVTGDNEPYDARKLRGGTLDRLADVHGLPHALFEIRNDLIQNEKNVAMWAARLAAAMGKILADESIRALPAG